ncbi:MAG TPA: hypothetical protein VFY48_00720 [Solirubrobacterales bacterium]|nr:hypothetical protein [Solirubrobacterales bacterium]
MEVPDELLEAKDAIQADLLALPGVTGVGIGMREEDGELFEEELALRVYVEDLNAVPDGIPSELSGWPVSVVEMNIEPCMAADMTRYEELKGGIRIAHPSHGSGTLGTIVKELREDEEEPNYYALTAQHVVGSGEGEEFPHIVWQAESPPIFAGAEVASTDSVGEVRGSAFPTLPPGVGGAVVGDVDAAIVSLDWAAGEERGSSAAIADDSGAGDLVEAVTETALPLVGDQVRKRGFATRLTHGFVIDAHHVAPWSPGGANHWLAEQVVIAGTGGTFCAQGDSGSLVLEEESPTAVGLLWAQELGGRRGVACKWRNVERALGVTPVL